MGVVAGICGVTTVCLGANMNMRCGCGDIYWCATDICIDGCKCCGNMLVLAGSGVCMMMVLITEDVCVCVCVCVITLA